MIWIIGEYAERIDNADELLESFLEGFQDENSQVKTYTNVDLRETFVLLRFRFIVLNSTFNTISVISWRSVLLVEETRVPVENHRHGASH
jgi:hypothetical protein